MKMRFFQKLQKRLIVGCLAAAIAVAQPVSSVFCKIRIMTDVIQWLRRNLFILQELPVQSHQEKKVNSKAWKKIQRCLL